MTASLQPSTINHPPSTIRIVTNMAFWQSRAWTENTRSIYPMTGRTSDPAFDSPWTEACRLFIHRGSHDVVVTMGARASLLYGLMCLLTFQESKQIMTEAFLDDARSGSLLWRLKILLYRAIARRALGILTNSSAEISTIGRRFRIPESRVRYVPMHSNIHKPEFSELNDGFVFSAGRTRRDYATLLQAAPQIGISVLIIAGAGDSFPASLPKNVSILRDVSRSVYLDYLRRCSLVILPLLPTERSTGQVVLLEAMALGKPVVTTRSPGTADIVRDGENALFVEPGDADGWVEKIRYLIGHPDAAQRIGRTAVEDVRRAYTFDIHAKAKLNSITELWKRTLHQREGAETFRGTPP